MSDPERLDATVAKQEGFEEIPYLDTEKLWTFASGRCLETHPLSGSEWKRLLDNRWLSVAITIEGATWLRQTELAAVEAHLSVVFTWWHALNDARQNALIDMGYQMGVEKLQGFHQMLTAINSGNWAEAYAQALDSEWARETPARAKAVATQLRDGVFV